MRPGWNTGRWHARTGFGGIALRQTLDVPVIARVNGHAAGGGFEMVLGCDLVIAAEEGNVFAPRSPVGRLPLDGGMTLLQRQIPFRAAMGLMLTGRRIKAAEALALGIVNEVVPARRSGCRCSALAGRYSGLRSAFGARHQAGGAPDCTFDRARGASAAPASPSWKPCNPRTRQRACVPYVEKRKPDWMAGKAFPSPRAAARLSRPEVPLMFHAAAFYYFREVTASFDPQARHRSTWRQARSTVRSSTLRISLEPPCSTGFPVACA